MSISKSVKKLEYAKKDLIKVIGKELGVEWFLNKLLGLSKKK